MNSFEIRIDRQYLDLDRCLVSGQVFRFTKAGEIWSGTDGKSRFEFIQSDSKIEVKSNGTLSDVEAFFRLDEPLDLVAHLMAHHPGINLKHPETIGLRMLRPSSPAECVLSFLCTPNNNLTRIQQMVSRLAEFGEGGCFPSLARVATISEDELRNLGFGYRAKTIPQVASALSDRGGERYLEEVKRWPYPKAREMLIELPGIGPKLADCICLYALDMTESVPVDTHLWQAACRNAFPEWVGSNLTDKKNNLVGDLLRTHYGRWAGHAQLFLYYSNMQGVR